MTTMATVGKFKKQYSGFIPTDISGCAVWLDIADTSTITTTGSTISSIRNKGTLGGNVVVSVGTPSYGTGATINGINCVSIKSGDALVIPSLTFTSTAKTVFNVFRVTSIPASGNRGIVTFGVTNQTNYMDVSVDVSTSNYLYSMAKNGVGTRVRATSSVYNQLNTVYAFGIRGMNTTFNKVSINFANQTPLTVNLTDTFALLARNYLIGVSTSVVGWDFVETIVFDGSISDANYLIVEGYLAWKWGMVSDLPSGHPYKTFPPFTQN